MVPSVRWKSSSHSLRCARKAITQHIKYFKDFMSTALNAIPSELSSVFYSTTPGVQPSSRLVAPSVSFAIAVSGALDTAAPPAMEPSSGELSLHSAVLDSLLRSGSTFSAAGGKALVQRDPSTQQDDLSPSTFVRLNGMMSLSSAMTPSAAAGERSSGSLGLVAPSPLSSESAVTGGEDDSVSADENDDGKEREVDVLGGTAPAVGAPRVTARSRRLSDDPSLFLTSSNNVIGRDISPLCSSRGVIEAQSARRLGTSDFIETLAVVGTLEEALFPSPVRLKPKNLGCYLPRPL